LAEFRVGLSQIYRKNGVWTVLPIER
jgi:hypothetical protein